MKNQGPRNSDGEMTHARLYFKCTASNCKKEIAFHCFETIYEDHNLLNERQTLYILCRLFLDTEATIAANARTSINTVKNCKKNLFALLYELY